MADPTDPARDDGPRQSAPRAPGTLRIGSIAGIDVLITTSWFVVAALISVVLAAGLVAAAAVGMAPSDAGAQDASGKLSLSQLPGAEGAEYIAVCLPAFSPDAVHRDVEPRG